MNKFIPELVLSFDFVLVNPSRFWAQHVWCVVLIMFLDSFGSPFIGFNFVGQAKRDVEGC